MSTVNQKWAQERNWTKGQLLCVRTICSTLQTRKSTLANESSTLGAVIKHLNELLEGFKKGESLSKFQFLGLYKKGGL